MTAELIKRRKINSIYGLKLNAKKTKKRDCHWRKNAGHDAKKAIRFHQCSLGAKNVHFERPAFQAPSL
jgi:hypothetical protein